MLESLYVRDSNMCSLFAVAIAVFSLAEKLVATVLVGFRFGSNWATWVKLGRVGTVWDMVWPSYPGIN